MKAAIVFLFTLSACASVACDKSGGTLPVMTGPSGSGGSGASGASGGGGAGGTGGNTAAPGTGGKSGSNVACSAAECGTPPKPLVGCPDGATEFLCARGGDGICGWSTSCQPVPRPDASPDATAGGGACQTDTDCRLFDDYCTGCDCRALAKGEPDPTCSGPGVRCFAQPCARKTAACVSNRCTVK